MDKELLKKIKDFYTLKKSEYNFFLGRNSDKKHKLFDKWDKFLLTSPYICSWIKNTTPKFNSDTALNLKLIWEYRDKQVQILDVIKNRYEEYNYKCWLIHLWTGWGKSLIMIWLYEMFKTDTLILVHNVKMIQEITDKFKDFLWVDIAPYYSKKKSSWHIMITTHTSFVKMNWDIPWCNAEVILYDECHLTLSDKMIKSLCNTKAQALYWFTWTPYTDKFNTEDLQVIYWKIIKPENDDYYYQPKFLFLNYDYLGRYDFDCTYADLRTQIFENKERQEKQIEELNKICNERWTVLILTDRVEEAHFYEEELKHLNTVKIIWETKDPDRLIKEAEKKGKVIIIWTYHKLWTWFDYPPIDTVCLFQPVKIKQSVVQCIWRGLRKYEWKEDCKVFVWNDMILKSQRNEKIKAIYQEYWEDTEIENVSLLNTRINFSIKKWNSEEATLKKINKFNMDNPDLFVPLNEKYFPNEKSYTTFMLWVYRKRWDYVFKIPDDSRWFKPYDFDLETKKNLYVVEAKYIKWYTFNSKILRDNQYSSLKKKYELWKSVPLVLVYSEKVKKYKYIPFEIILKEKELTLKLF